MQQKELTNLLEFTGKDPTRLVFEDELTSVYNRRFLFRFFESKISWENLSKDPLSLIMMDVDNFKGVNDSYGHQVGDKALIWVADILREVAGDEGLPIRYAGDEFMLLFLHCDKQTALKLGNRLINKVRSEHFKFNGNKKALPITLSLGVASAPEDAKTGKGLIQQADVALYFAKSSGRDCLVNASEVVQEAVFDKTAINQLEDVKLVGRGPQLSQVSEALTKFGQKQNQMLIAEGSAGLGKTEFLDTVRRSLARTKAWRIKVSGDPQEMFRPYYLMTSILVNLLNHRGDQGTAIINSLEKKHQVYIGKILPQLAPETAPAEDEDESTNRKGIFKALAHLFIKAAGNRPVFLFLDDLHSADEASLILLRQLLLLKNFSLFICGAAGSIQESDRAEHKIPLHRFYEIYQASLDIRKVILTPLSVADITKHIQGLFPNIKLHPEFAQEIFRISQGNPLFISELLRKLVLDRKITLVGQQWTIEPLEEGYLPKTLEEIVSHKIAALDEESRLILDQVSALGGDVSLSMLVGSSEQMETRVLEFIDQARAQGLISTNFHLNDEIITILGKQVLAITYGAIEPDRKHELHERIGNYQETLYERQLLPSAATLAYHFKRSTNQQKAVRYEKIQAIANNRNFNGQEAITYTVEAPGEGTEIDVPLKPEDLKRVPEIIRDFMVAVRNFKLYPPGSKSIEKINRQFKASLDQILDGNDILNIVQVKNSILINGQKIDVSEYKLVMDTFLKLLNRVELKGIAFHSGVTEPELEILLQTLGKTDKKTFDAGFWDHFSAEHQISNIELKQVQYAVKVRAAAGAGQSPAGGPGQTPTASAPSEQLATPLGPQEMKAIPEILRNLVAAARVIKLYPIKSKSVANTIYKLLETLQRFFSTQRVLAFSRAGDVLLVNGEKLITSGTSEFRGLTQNFMTLLGEIGLESLTFLESISVHQLETFIGALGDSSELEVNADYWKVLAEEQGLSAILFDQQLYEIQVAHSLSAGGGQAQAAGGESPMAMLRGIRDEPIAPERFEKYLDELPEEVNDLFLDGKPAFVEQAVYRVYLGLQDRELVMRNKVIEVWRRVLDRLTLAYQHDFAKILADPLLTDFGNEKEPKILVEMASLLSRLVTLFIQFVEYPLASRLLGHLDKRFQKFKQAKDSNAQLLARSMNRQLEPMARELLVEDLKSADPERQRNAAQLLGSLKHVAAPMLMEIIQREDNYRARQIAVILLEKLGPKTVERLKRLLVLEISAEERTRILEVIDTLTSDLKTELFHSLGDEDPNVRRAAYRLVERLNGSQILEWLREFMQSQKPALAASAVKCLGKLKPPDVETELIALLNSTDDDQLRIACCRALGQIAKPASIDSLFKLLLPKRSFLFRKNHNSQVRAAAAFALGQISHPKAAESLARFVEDDDPRVREIALKTTNSPASKPGQGEIAS
ncbi:MAG: diguanylate cyclase [Desulfobacterales bacterium]|nr:MAG: diguanylate cyclase [Desulfobacterales bacterium]